MNMRAGPANANESAPPGGVLRAEESGPDKDTVPRVIAFVVRCSGAATLAYELASALGLPQSLWAAMSAVIVSQERLHDTRSSLKSRVLGTLLGIVVTVAVSEATSRLAAPTALQMAVDVAICALIARRFPGLRVAMWTCPIILLTAQPTLPILVVALRRGSEVILGALVGWAFHGLAEAVVDAVSGALSRRKAG
jgi:uncharacterized membrane protein YccC